MKKKTSSKTNDGKTFEDILLDFQTRLQGVGERFGGETRRTNRVDRRGSFANAREGTAKTGKVDSRGSSSD